MTHYEDRVVLGDHAGGYWLVTLLECCPGFLLWCWRLSPLLLILALLIWC